MAKAEVGTFWGELASASLYKRNQGRLSRQLTGAGLAGLVGVGAWRLSQTVLLSSEAWLRYGVPIAIAAVGAWFAFRLVNYPRFAEFLISVEGEMSKVSWPSWVELRRSTVVVLSTMIFLGLVLFTYDFIWYRVLSWIGVLQPGS